MGWLWNSTQSATPPNSSPVNEPSPQSPSHTPNSSQQSSTTTTTSTNTFNPPTPTPDPAPEPRARTREEIANDEVIAFFRGIEADRKAAEAPELDDDDDNNADDDGLPDEEPPELMTPGKLYNPKSNCLELLDTAYLCASPTGHFLNIYRYGTVRQCSSLMTELMYCLRTYRTLQSDKRQEEKILRQAWNRERDRLKDRGGCAEQIWGEGRKWVERNAFKRDWEDEDSPFSKRHGGGA